MKLVLFFVLVVVNQAFGDAEDDGMDELAETTMREIARQMKSDMVFKRLRTYKRRRTYNSAFASHESWVDMDMEARRRDDSPVSCKASVDVRENSGQSNIRSYSCQEQKRSGFSIRSGETPCDKGESDDLYQKAKELINKSIQDENEAMQMPGMLDMPELQQQPIKINKLLKCTRVEVESGGIEYKLKLKGVQDGVPEDCDVSILRMPNGDFQMDQNQCQGLN